MARATILVTATPGAGPDLVRSVRDDPSVRRAFATMGRFEAVVEVVAADHHALLQTIARINAHPAQLASETLLDMQVEAAPDIKEATT